MPSAIRITDPTDPTRCCPCGDQVGCGCNSGNCGLRCRTRGAFTAALCGFEEFSDDDNPASTPPRRYRKKTITTDKDGENDIPFAQTAFSASADCSDDCAGVWCSSFSGRVSGIDFDLVVTGGIKGALQLLGIENVDGVPMATYKAAVEAYYIGGDPYPPGHPIPLESAVGLEGYATRLYSGDVISLPVSVVPRATSLQINYAGWVVITTGCMTPGKPSPVTINDGWEYTGQYNKDTCALTQSGERRQKTVTGNCGESSESNAVIHFDSTLLDFPMVYGAGAKTTVGDTPASATTTGTGCISNGTSSNSYLQNNLHPIRQELSDEDTLDDAIARAVVGHDWGAAKACDPGNAGTAFITPRGDTDTEFAFRQAQFQATVKDAIPGHTYELTIGISARAVGSGGPFTPYGEVTITFTATEETPAVTPWHDLPCEEGLETQATSCNAVET